MSNESARDAWFWVAVIFLAVALAVAVEVIGFASWHHGRLLEKHRDAICAQDKYALENCPLTPREKAERDYQRALATAEAQKP